MPYIKQDRRAVLDDWLVLLFKRVDGEVTELRASGSEPQDCGELNYCFTMTCIGHNRIDFSVLDRKLLAIGTIYLLRSPLRYQRINDAIGACECAALELERRRPGAKKFEAVTLRYLARRLYSEIGVGYELQKISENGDIDFGESADAAALQQRGS